jgi:NAD(P)-dependent dehydrogenase (short-subunit alcohol dehydrogenase family)
MSDMNGRVALITGASSGIGQATAELFAARGAKVVVAARRRDELDALVRGIEARGGTASAVRTDVAVSADVARMVDHTITQYGRLDYAINNAGIEGQLAGITELEEDEWDRVLGINLKGTFLCMQKEARTMLAAGHGGAIVNVGSVNSFLGFATGSAYCTSKHGLIGLTTSVSAELASKGIRVNLVCPGIIETPMHRRLRRDIGDEVYDQGLLPKVHLQRAGQPEEIARAIVFLCSDDASYITGTTLTPDGGLTLTV